MFISMQKGIARGIFSNEASLGSKPTALVLLSPVVAHTTRDFLARQSGKVSPPTP